MSADDFCINKFVPGYFSRINEDGSYSNGSGCGNDTASERNMVRKYIVDSVCYWADVFEYYKGLIKFRKAHPALRLSTSEDVKKYVKSIEGLGDNIVGINMKVQKRCIFFLMQTLTTQKLQFRKENRKSA